LDGFSVKMLPVFEKMRNRHFGVHFFVATAVRFRNNHKSKQSIGEAL
jgi:hypothetical protein